MAETIKQTEAIPASYPSVSPRWVIEQAPEDEVPDDAQIWQRIESYIAYRWTERQVIWIVQGCGEWVPPLTPTTITTVECWQGGEWVEATPVATALGGYDFAGDGPYRITADVGSGTPPAAVQEAFKRLHEYSRGIVDSFKNQPAQIGDSEDGIMANWTARALQLSGAADLLRPYRRAP